MRQLKTALLITIATCAIASTAMASTFASQMHYGKPAATATNAPGDIVVTNYTQQIDTLQAWFSDGSYGSMPIYALSQSPDNIVSIPASCIQIVATDPFNNVLVNEMPYPGEYIPITTYKNKKAG
ncbi:MAG TPA: hypothetical protein VI844_01225 [Coxiellaceae bacterium]|nr:hypothetical protein [Coxiellaceae bacterium]